MRAVPISSGSRRFQRVEKHACSAMQAVVAGRLAAVLPVTEHGAMVGTALGVEIDRGRTGPSSWGPGSRTRP